MSDDTRFPVWHFVVGITLVVMAIFVADRNFLLFHGLAEFASIAVAWAILMMALPSRRFSTNDYLLFLGIAYAGVGFLDLVHTLSYKGMGSFRGSPPMSRRNCGSPRDISRRVRFSPPLPFSNDGCRWGR